MKCPNCGRETKYYGWRDRQGPLAEFGYGIPPDDAGVRYETSWYHDEINETCVRYSSSRPVGMDDHLTIVTPCDEGVICRR